MPKPENQTQNQVGPFSYIWSKYYNIVFQNPFQTPISRLVPETSWKIIMSIIMIDFQGLQLLSYIIHTCLHCFASKKHKFMMNNISEIVANKLTTGGWEFEDLPAVRDESTLWAEVQHDCELSSQELSRVKNARCPVNQGKYPSYQFLSIHHLLSFHLLISSYYSPSNCFLLVL